MKFLIAIYCALIGMGATLSFFEGKQPISDLLVIISLVSTLYGSFKRDYRFVMALLVPTLLNLLKNANTAMNPTAAFGFVLGSAVPVALCFWAYLNMKKPPGNISVGS